jgi:SNF2 family DNA or RNA helicase
LRPKSDLRPYQQRLATYLYEHDQGIAVVRMGGGKTIASLTAIGELINSGEINHALIVAPKRVAEKTWPDEIAGWAHTTGLRYELLNGSPIDRADGLDRRFDRRLTIIGIDNLQWLIDRLEKLPVTDPIFDCLVLDEISRLRSPKSKRAKALAKVINRFRNRWGLTGTPRPNGYEDLFMPARLITCSKLWGRSFYTWRDAHFYPTDYMRYHWKVKPGQDNLLVDDFRTISMTLDDADMPELPEITTLVNEIRLPDELARDYRRMQRTLFAEFNGTPITAMSAAAAVSKLAQVCNGFVYDGEGDSRTTKRLHNSKLEWLEDLIDSLAGQPLLIAYEFQEDLRALKEWFGADLPYLGAGVSGAQANRVIDAWNARDLPLMALHPASGGHGLNLQHGGSNIAWPSLTWSPELYEQTIARLHRPGQAGKVTVHVCEVRDSVDMLKRWRVIEKIDDQAAFRLFLDRL